MESDTRNGETSAFRRNIATLEPHIIDAPDTGILQRQHMFKVVYFRLPNMLR